MCNQEAYVLDNYLKDYERNNGNPSDLEDIPLYEYNTRPNLLTYVFKAKEDQDKDDN
jgi:hypothetical protein